MLRFLSLSVALAIGFASLAAAQEKPAVKAAPQVRFKRTQLDAKFRSEGVAVADFNKDGKMDIAAGFVWYEASGTPGKDEWKMHQLTEKAPEYDPKGYSNAFCCFAEDVNVDGWSDLLVVDFPGTPTWWFENPKETGKLWPKHTVTPVTNNESPQYLDIDGDGKKELLMGFAPSTKESDGPDRQVGFAKPTKDPKEPWTLHAVSEKGVQGAKKYDHGIGLGDINGDKRLDIMVASGWFEAPANPSDSPWKFHAANFGLAAQMYAYDFDGDGDNDVLTSSPHAFGLWWHEQVGPNQWKQHEISKEFSQIHGVMLADMNGDKLPDIVCGKRWWAHAAGDPGVNDPAVFFWFELKRENGRPVWTPHQFDHNSGPGTQFEVADVNGDGLLDIISSNKKGVHYFEQTRE